MSACIRDGEPLARESAGNYIGIGYVSGTNLPNVTRNDMITDVPPVGGDGIIIVVISPDNLVTGPNEPEVQAPGSREQGYYTHARNAASTAFSLSPRILANRTGTALPTCR